MITSKMTGTVIRRMLRKGFYSWSRVFMPLAKSTSRTVRATRRRLISLSFFCHQPACLLRSGQLWGFLCYLSGGKHYLYSRFFLSLIIYGFLHSYECVVSLSGAFTIGPLFVRPNRLLSSFFPLRRHCLSHDPTGRRLPEVTVSSQYSLQLSHRTYGVFMLRSILFVIGRDHIVLQSDLANFNNFNTSN